MLEFVLLLLVLSLLWIIVVKRKYNKFPPGPPLLPLIGSMLFIPRSKYPAVSFEKLAKKYGDVVHIKMGVQDAIIINYYDAVKEILAEDKASDRKSDFSQIFMERMFRRNLGIGFSNNASWNTMRRFTIRTLRNFGFGKASSMDVVINQEIDKLIEKIKSEMSSNPEAGIQTAAIFHDSLFNIIWRLVTGVELELGNQKTQRFLMISEKLLKSGNHALDLSIVFPFLWHVFPKLSGKREQMNCLHELFQFGRDLIAEHRSSGVYKVDPQSYIDVFLAKIDETKDNLNSDFNDDQLLICLMDLFQGGGETSSNTLSFTMLYMLLNPKVQEKAWQEIKSQIRKEELITEDKKVRLPYTHATLLEIFRMSSVAPFPPARMATEDFYFKGHLIKKGVAIMLNLQSANMTKSQWGDPHNFRPERFLAEDGTVNTRIVSWMVTFGDGKRVCPGQSLAESSIFIYFASLLRTFKLVKVSGQPDPSLEPSLGMSYSPQPFKIRFIPRE